MSAASSEATEQLVVTARTTLVQVQNILETQSNEGARRLREAQVNFIATRRNRSSSTSASHDSVHEGQESDQQASGRHSSATERITPSEGHSFAETAIRGRLWRDVKVCYPCGVNVALVRHAFIERLMEKLNYWNVSTIRLEQSWYSFMEEETTELEFGCYPWFQRLYIAREFT